MTIIQLLNSNILTSFVTLLAGAIAFTVYVRRKNDAKRSFASLILIEIRSAEQGVINIKNRVKKPGGSPIKVTSEDGLLLPVNSWIKYSHLFIRDLDIDEWRVINDLMIRCEAFDEVLTQLKNDLPHQIQQKEGYFQKILLDLALENAQGNLSDQDYAKQRELFINKANIESAQFDPLEYFKLDNMIDNIDTNISTSSAGTKLKKISGL